MRLVRRLAPLAFAVASLGAFACNDPARLHDPDGAASTITAIPDSAAWIRGVITDASVTGGASLAESSGSVRVEADPSKHDDSPKAVVRWSGDSTRIYRRDGSPATPDELARGVTVRVWITGPVLESYPAQVRARVIVVE